MKLVPLIIAVLTALSSARAAEKQLLPDSAAEAWQAVEKASAPPAYPSDWTGAPTEEQKRAFQKMLAEKSVEAAEKSREFHTRFPQHEHADDAKEKEHRFVQQAISFGAENLPDSLKSTLSDEEQIALKMNLINSRAMAKRPEGMPAVIDEFENGLRGLMKEFPKNGALWSQLMIVAQSTDDEARAKKLLQEIASAEAADEETREQAKGLLRVKDAVGRPLKLAFTATDGSEIDVQKMNGKVVLLDFWASWCGPCIASLPEVIEVYQRHHPKGLEILGINLDQKREAMDAAIEKFQIPWRQYFDGRGWANRYAMEFGINAIPSMWLVDKRGILRSTNAREDLEGKVKELLAEPEKL